MVRSLQMRGFGGLPTCSLRFSPGLGFLFSAPVTLRPPAAPPRGTAALAATAEGSRMGLGGVTEVRSSIRKIGDLTKRMKDLANKIEKQKMNLFFHPAKMEIEPTALGIEHDLL